MAEEFQTAKGSHLEPLSVVWHIVAAPQTLLVLMGLIALALAVGSLVPQIPLQAMNDPQAWLAAQPGFWGRQNGLIRALNLFDLYRAWWFRLLLALTGLTLFVRAVETAELACRGGKERWTAESLLSWTGSMPQAKVPSPLPPEESLARLRDWLTRRRYRLADLPALSLPGVVAVRHGAALWAQPVAYAAFLAALVGLLIVGTWGWQQADWQPAPGETRSVGHDSPYTVRLEAFDLRLGEGGRLQSYRSEIAWLEGQAVIRREVVGVGQPAVLRGVAVRQVGYVPVVRMRGWDAAGQPVTLQAGRQVSEAPGIVRIEFSSPEARPLVYLPAQDLVVALAFAPFDAAGRPALSVNLLQDGGTGEQLLAVLHQSGVIAAGDLALELEVAYRPILHLDYRPAMGLVVGGLALAVVALAIAWAVAPQLLWLVVGTDEGNRVVVYLLVPTVLREGRWLPQVADRLGEALADGG